jgi:hypothetical protein
MNSSTAWCTGPPSAAEQLVARSALANTTTSQGRRGFMSTQIG